MIITIIIHNKCDDESQSQQNGNAGREREKNLHTTLKQKAQSLSDYAQQDFFVMTRRPRILDMQRLQVK
jgi:hypothetical protein